MFEFVHPARKTKRVRPLALLLRLSELRRRTDRAPRSGKFAAALGLGALVGLWIARTPRAAAETPSMPRAALWRKAIEAKFGPNAGAVVYAETLARYQALMEKHPDFAHPALGRHFARGIAPGLALYETLRSRRSAGDLALSDARDVIATFARQSPRRASIALLQHVPQRFTVFRKLTKFFTRLNYPPAGWDIEWRRDDDDELAFDIRRCFYKDVLAAYGAPELTAAFCAGDDVLFNALPPGIAWERTGTLATGNTVCDFCWRNRASAPDRAQAALARSD
jgi:L-2-amino-thiazoline-4-carboxylic acid hydrolase